MSKIADRFKELRKNKGKAFIPYVMAGDPSLEDTKKLVFLLEESGADIIELGVPFTDPLADGPVIQRAAERAIENSVTLKDVLGLVKGVRHQTSIPLILMTYFNPVFKYGVERFLKDAHSAGVDGLIIPDLPPDEAGDLITFARREDVDTIFLLAPTSTPDRIKAVAKSSSGFVYYVSITGVTGSSLSIGPELMKSISCLKRETDLPVAVGFGVSTPEEAKKIAAIADGVIVGSAIVKRIFEHGIEDKELRAYLKSLKEAIG